MKLLTEAISAESEQFLSDQIDEAVSELPQDLIDGKRERLEEARQDAFQKSRLVTRTKEQFRIASNSGTLQTHCQAICASEVDTHSFSYPYICTQWPPSNEGVSNRRWTSRSHKRHFEGRYINDARKTKFKVNARFASNYKTNTCPATGLVWVRIYATRPIKAGEEVFLNYGAAFWRDMQLSAAQSPIPPPANDISSTTNSAISRTSSLWAASAYIPGDTPEHEDDQCSMTMTTQQHNSEVPPITITWPDQTPAPSSPALLGHFRHPNQQYTQDTTHSPHHQSIQFHTPLSPIARGPSTNPNIHMNEIYSFHQMYNIDDTILLPVNVDNHR